MVSKSTYYVLAVRTSDGMRYLHGDDLTDNIYDTNWFNGADYAKLMLKTMKGEAKNYAKSMESYIQENQKELTHCMEYLATHHVEDSAESVLTRFRNRMKKADENLRSINDGIAAKRAFEEKIEDLHVYALVASYNSYTLTTELQIDEVVY